MMPSIAFLVNETNTAGFNVIAMSLNYFSVAEFPFLELQ